MRTGAGPQGAALVTGAGTRLGRAMALYLAGRGFDVAVHYATSRDGAEEVASLIRAMGRSAVTLQADLLDAHAARALVPDAASALGPLGVLVNSASIFEHDTLQSATDETWDRHFGSNLRAPFLLTQAFAAQCPAAAMDAEGEPVASGLVVNMVDERVRKPSPEFMTYTLAKMGLWALTRTAAQALAPRVRVNAIGPGPTLRASRQTEAHFARQRAAMLLERGADAGDITAALGYFLDAKAVTGQLLCVDGGQHLLWRTRDILGPG